MTRFLLASDLHFGEPDTAYSSNLEWLTQKAREAGKLDFILFNGDLTHDRPEYIPTVLAQLASLNIPVVPVKGNHDHIGEGDWLKLTGFNFNFTYTVDNQSYISLNTSDASGNYHPPDLHFLRGALSGIDNSAFLVLHIPSDQFSRHGIDLSVLGDVLPDPRVRAILVGHDHDIKGVHSYFQTPMIFAGHTGGSWGGPRSYWVFESETEGWNATLRQEGQEDFSYKF